MIAITYLRSSCYGNFKVVPGQLNKMYGGVDAPFASTVLNNISNLNDRRNMKVANALYPIVQKYLGVPENRLFILTHNNPYESMGITGTTYENMISSPCCY